MTRYDFSRLEDEHYDYMFDRYFADSEYAEDEPTEFRIYWHNEEFEDIETVEAKYEEEAREKAEEILPEDAVIDKIVA